MYTKYIKNIHKIYIKYIQNICKKTMRLISSRKLGRVNVLFNDAVYNQVYVASMIDKQMSLKAPC